MPSRRPRAGGPPRANPRGAIQDWLNLVEPDGAFLTTTELLDAFPSGFDPMDAELRTELRARVAEIDTDLGGRRDLRDWLLGIALDWNDQLAYDQRIPVTATARIAEQGVHLRPDAALLDVDDRNRVRLGMFTWQTGTRLDRRPDATITGDSWPATPIQRAENWCREVGVPLALVTDDDQWVLVWAPRGAPAGTCRWRLSDLADERILQAGLVSLLGSRRFFAVAEDKTLERLFERAADAEVEITKGLGLSVRRSVELLVAAISHDDVASDGRVLDGVTPTEVYEASVSVLMRLVFLLFAEERRLLPGEDPLWAESYSVLSLRDDLRTAASRDGEDALERRATAWHRLLATFRAVHGGANHDRLTLPAYGGSLFDPDRYPFLEGRRTPDHIIVNDVNLGPVEDTAVGRGRPVAIDDRTVLAILDALLNVKVRVGRATITQRVSYKALDVEQIGHCYEGLLDHGCAPIDVLSLGLIGAEGGEPEIAITDLEARLSAGTGALCEWLEDKTRCNRKASALAKELERQPDALDLARLRVACGHDDANVERVLPFWGLIRTDLRGLPVILLPGSKYVIQTSTRRNMGAEYTTKALAEEVVRYALEPLVYDPGPQNEADRENWRLKTPAEILDLRVCDPAVGSGAILTAAARFLGDRLIESVTEHGVGESHFASRLSDLAAAPADEQTLLARREVVDHCLYGVDKNPVAAEMAKLSLWLTTMARERPFTFLDHAIQVGDSLLGITDLEQLRWLHLNPSKRKGNAGFETLTLDLRIKEAAELAQRLQKLSVVTVRDATAKQRLHDELRAKLADLAVVADTVVGAALSTTGIPGMSMEQRLDTQLDRIVAALDADRPAIERSAALDVLRNLSTGWLRTDLPDEPPMPWDRQCLHWPFAFPEVFVGNARWGFDAFVANPPYMGNKYWKERVGGFLQPFYAKLIGVPLRKPDIIVLFMWRFTILLGPSGTIGALATQSISEVDSKALMADHVLDSLEIHRAVRSRQWPGEANIVVSQLWMHRGTWNSSAILDGVEVDGIGADLQPVGVALEPAVLADRLFAFEGIHNARGRAFVVDSEDELTRYTEFFRPFVSGEDISQADPLKPKRSILDLTGWSEDRLADLPEPVRRYLFEVVQPTRTPEELKSYPNLAKRWWTFWRTLEDLFARSRTTPICVAMPAIAKYLVPLSLPSSWAFSNKAIVVQVERPDTQAILLSPAFDVWARKFGGSMGAGRVMKIASVIDTFPLPEGQVDQSLADEWQQVLISCIRSNETCATDVLNRVADEQDQEQEIVKLRSLYNAIHIGVSTAYGWDAVPWTPLAPNDVSASVMLTRLLVLNEEQHNRELLAGINTKSRKRTATVASRVVEPPSSQERLL